MRRSQICAPLFERGEESQRLERGTAVCRFQYRARPEAGNLSVRRETGHLIWQTNQSKTVLVSLLEIKYIVPGKNSKDFEKWPDVSSRHDSSKCFILYYTAEFKYKTLSVAALSERERQDWLEGIPYLVREAKAAGHVTQLERMLRTIFYTVQNQVYRAGVREVLQLITRLHFDEREQRVRSLIRKVDEAEHDEINFDQFCELIKMLMWEEQKKLLEDSMLTQYCSAEGNTCSVALFKSFLSDQQKQDHMQAADMMRLAIDDRERDVAQPSFSADEFLQYLFSKENEIWDEKYNVELQDMTRPLSHYFIASSHNTYLVGKQIGDESSVEAYVRALRLGCRCIELDTWPKDGKIYIYHGFAFTTKILLENVLHAIKAHAFYASPYPVILSIEDHCNPPQQREMARLLREVFGSMLVTEPLERGETMAPPLHLLKGRIILKHKKQQPDMAMDGTGAVGGANTVATQDEGNVAAVRRGLLYRRHPVSQHQWQKHYFILSNTHLYYTHACEDTDGDQDLALAEPSCNLPPESRHQNEPWYHDRSIVTRAAAEELLSRHCTQGDGTFLVRRSENFVGDYTLSFWHRGQCHHCRIHSHQDADRTRYYLKESEVFDTLYDLVEHYKESVIHSQSVVAKLGSPVPQPDSHERMPWYHANLDRHTAELCLYRLNQDGVFLVRPSSKHAGQFAVSFRACNGITHCRISHEDGVFVLSSAVFGSLVELVDYYSRANLYKNTRLRYPVPPSVLQSVLAQDRGVNDNHNVTESYYVSNIRVKATKNFSARHTDELTFPAHAIIHNVNQVNPDWWKGDYGGLRQAYFPANHVVVLPSDAPDSRVDQQLLGSMQQGSVDLLGATAILQPTPGPGPVQAILRLMAGLVVLEVGFETLSEASEWLKDIRELALKDEPFEMEVRAREGQVVWAKQMSDLVVYFEPVNFNKAVAFTRGGIHNQVSSHTEVRFERLMDLNHHKLLQYHKVGFSRVYPTAKRYDSTNFNPMPMWCHGVQCVALNYQTGDRGMQMNHGLFRQNGGCGYVLRPNCHFDEQYNPVDPSTLRNTPAYDITIKVLAGRHLSRNRRGVMSPHVEVELIGCDYETNLKHTTSSVASNGLCPVWFNETFKLRVLNPQQSLLRFVVYEEAVFAEQVEVAQAIYPVTCLRTGFRSVPLLNEFSEPLELASLLVHYSVNVQRPTSTNGTAAVTETNASDLDTLFDALRVT